MKANQATRFALAAAAGLALAASTRAQSFSLDGELLAGFTGGVNDVIIDLGKASTITPGQTWDVGVNLGTRFGVVGYQNAGKVIYATSPVDDQAGFNPQGLFASARVNVTTIGTGISLSQQTRTVDPAESTSWHSQTDLPAGTPGVTFQNNFYNPNVPVGSPAFVFKDANTGAVVPMDKFVYNSNSGQLAYAPVPEPSASFALAVAGLAWAGYRRLSAHSSQADRLSTPVNTL